VRRRRRRLFFHSAMAIMQRQRWRRWRVRRGGRGLHFRLAQGCLSTPGGVVGTTEVSNKSSLRGSESGGPSEGVCFSGAPLGLPMLSGHDGRNRGMEGVRGGGGGMLVAS
jgi:hypothetical protein